MSILDRFLRRRPAINTPVELSEAMQAQLRQRAAEIYQEATEGVRESIRRVRETCNKLVKDNIELRDQGDQSRKTLREQGKELDELKRVVFSLVQHQQASQMAVADLSRHVESATGKKPTAAVSAVVASAALAQAIEGAPSLTNERRRPTSAAPQG